MDARSALAGAAIYLGRRKQHRLHWLLRKSGQHCRHNHSHRPASLMQYEIESVVTEDTQRRHRTATDQQLT